MRRPLVLGFLAACFHPTLGDQPFKCGASGECPPDYSCVDTFCRLGGTTSGPDARPAPDAKPGTPDAAGGPDARPAPDARAVPDGASVPDARPGDAPPCAAGFVRCFDDQTAVFCTGGVEQKQSCAFRCDADARLCEQCDPGQPNFCASGDVLGSCGPDGQLGPTTPCASFCAAGQCRTLEPSNLPASTCDAPAASPLAIGIDTTIDTTACDGGHIVSQTNGAVPICVLTVSDFTIAARVTLSVMGTNPLAIVATHDLAVAGNIDASARGASNGPGVFASVGTGKNLDTGFGPGGGGGGFGQTGGAGGTDQPGVVAGGGSFGADSLLPVTGGAAGGRAGISPQLCNVDCPTPAPGGGGGGGVELVACHVLHLGADARVVAVGGGGGGGFASILLVSAGGGGGGGSGGGIVIEAPAYDVAAGAAAVATGGGGGGGGSHDTATDGQPGAPGAPDHGATGGAPGSPKAGAGGDGATGTPVAPGPGPGGGASAGYGSGGGGGGVGRIRINARKDLPSTGTGITAVPPASFGGISSH